MAHFLSVVLRAVLHVECLMLLASLAVSRSVHVISLEVEVVSAGPVPVLGSSLGKVNWVGVLEVPAELDLAAPQGLAWSVVTSNAEVWYSRGADGVHKDTVVALWHGLFDVEVHFEGLHEGACAPAETSALLGVPSQLQVEGGEGSDDGLQLEGPAI